MGDNPGAVAAYRTLLKLDPGGDLPDIHYRLARALQATGNRDAKREVLLALEETPRFREALALLLKIEDSKPLAGKEEAVH